MNELQEIIAAKRGDNDALARLLHQYYLFVLKYLLQVTVHRPTAEDLTQDTMIRAIEKIALYDEQRSKFSTWLITIATRLYLDYKRRRQRETAWLSAEASTRHLKWEVENAQGSWPELLDAMVGLPKQTRTAIVLKHYYGYTYEEIADMVKLPVGTVKSRVHHGLATLRKEWRAE